MSLACYECGKIREFDTLVLFDADGVFNFAVPISWYCNFYTCCASFDGVAEATQPSRFAMVKTRAPESCWNTGADGDAINVAQFKCVDEEDLRAKLPKIYDALLAGGG